MLASIHDLLKPFAQYTSVIGGEDYTNPNEMKSAKAHLLKLRLRHSESSSATQSPKPSPSTRMAEEPPTKRLCHLASFLRRQLEEDKKKLGKKQPGEQELDTYIATSPSLPEHVDPVIFWIEQENISFTSHPCSRGLDYVCVFHSSLMHCW